MFFMHLWSKLTSEMCQKVGSLGGKPKQNCSKAPILPLFWIRFYQINQILSKKSHQPLSTNLKSFWVGLMPQATYCLSVFVNKSFKIYRKLTCLAYWGVFCISVDRREMKNGLSSTIPFQYVGVKGYMTVKVNMHMQSKNSPHILQIRRDYFVWSII